MFAGQMMDFPLSLVHVFDRARTLFPKTRVVSRRSDGSVHSYTYADFAKRTAKLAHALRRLGVGPGDRVATLMWNHERHLEAYFAVPCMGAVVHTLNLRLHPRELGYIAQHAGDRVLLVDESLLPLYRGFANEAKCIERVIVVREGPGAVPDGMLEYEALLAPEPDTIEFPRLDENSAAQICYTSGTTGNPKGVVYSHRSCVLHALVLSSVDTMGISARDVILPVVPMFHANAWGIPHAALLAGASLVFPGPKLDPASLLDLMASEHVTMSAGVPTIWLGILALLDQDASRWDLRALERMAVGGSAAPAAMIDGFQKRHGLTVEHAWGMTETNPVGTFARIKPHLETGDDAARLAIRASQGFPVPFVEERHTDDTGRILPWDGTSMGELEVRGPWVAAAYLGGDGKDRFTKDGWFKTGDVVTIDAEGYVRICDRSKDVIKSGGEWISSVDLENALMAHPAVLEAAVFAAKDPKWDERPVAAIVFKPGQKASDDELRAHLEGRFVKFWMPERFIAMEQIPRTSTGKFLKTRLRELYGDVLVRGG